MPRLKEPSPPPALEVQPHFHPRCAAVHSGREVELGSVCISIEYGYCGAAAQGLFGQIAQYVARKEGHQWKSGSIPTAVGGAEGHMAADTPSPA
jgi:hypothetical protein